MDEVDEVVGEVVGRSSNPISPHQVAIMMSYIYTLVVESRNPSSILASFLIWNAKKVVCGLLVAHWWRREVRNF